jgi:hypothetical protein
MGFEDMKASWTRGESERDYANEEIKGLKMLVAF